MNIFILSNKSSTLAAHIMDNAAMHCDKHVVKMILESTQMLVTALSTTQFAELGTYMPASIVDYLPCKPLAAGHSKHPCMKWAKADFTNFNYLACLASQLTIQYTLRYGKIHAYHNWILDLYVELSNKGFGFNGDMPTSFTLAVKTPHLTGKLVNLQDAVSEYRAYYILDKAAFAKWDKLDNKPLWFVM